MKSVFFGLCAVLACAAAARAAENDDPDLALRYTFEEGKGKDLINKAKATSGILTSHISEAEWVRGRNQQKWALELYGVRASAGMNHTKILNMGTGSFTLEAWIRPDTLPGLGGGWSGIISKKVNTPNHHPGYTLAMFNTGNQAGKVVFQTHDTTAKWHHAPTSTRPLNDRKWHHVVVVFDTQDRRQQLYIDGALDAQAPVATGSLDNTASFNIGVLGSTRFRGLIDEVSVYKRALRETEIAKQYERGKALIIEPKDGTRNARPPLVAYLHSGYRPNMENAHNGTFAQLGWPHHKWKNVHIRRLAANLDHYDVVLGSTLFNLKDPQDFKVHRAEWLSFLKRGGVIVVAGPQDDTAQWDWIVDLGEDFRFEIRTFRAFQKHNDWTNHEADLDFGPVSAAWANFSSWSPKWTVTNRDANGKPIILYQRVGKGLVVVSTTYQSMFTRRKDLARIWEFARRAIAEDPLEIMEISWGKEAVGPSKVDFTVGNRSADPVDFRAVVTRFNKDNPPASETRTARIAPGQETKLSMSYGIASGPNEVALALESARDDRVYLRTGARCDLLDTAGRLKELDRHLDDAKTGLDRLKGWPQEIVAPPSTQREALAATSAALKAELEGAAPDRRACYDGIVAAGEKARYLAARLATWGALEITPKPRQRFLAFKSASLQKIYRDRAWRGPVPADPDLELAANEYESFQVVIVPLQGALKGVRVACSALKSAEGNYIRDVQVRPVADVFLRLGSEIRRWYPDALLAADSFDVPADHVARGIWITAHTAPDAPAGLYAGTLTVSAAGAPQVALPVRVKVRGFAVPHKRNLLTEFHCRPNQLAGFYFGRKTTHQYWKYLPASTYHRFVEYILQYRIAVHPYDDFQGPSKSATAYLGEKREGASRTTWKVTELDFTHFDKHVQLLIDNGVGDLVLAGCMLHDKLEGEYSKETYWRSFLPKMYEHLKEKGWDKKAYIYGYDEFAADKLPYVRAQYDLVKELAPTVKYLLTYNQPDGIPEVGDAGYADIWVPVLNQYTRQFVEERAGHGQSVWGYTVAGFEAYRPTNEYRSLFWRVWRERYQGFLYYCTAFYWWKVGPVDLNPDGSPKETFLPPDNPGMNYFIYPASGNPEDGLHASIRLECIRDGLEDWEYLHMLNNLIEKSDNKESPQVKAAAEMLRHIDAGTGEKIPGILPPSRMRRRSAAEESLRLQRRAVAEMIETMTGR